MKITVKQLRGHGAYEEQVEMFQALIGTEVTEALCVRHTQDVGAATWDWAAGHLFSPSAWATYEAARTSARAEYEAARAPAWATYEAARTSARGEYEAAVARAFGRAAAA